MKLEIIFSLANQNNLLNDVDMTKLENLSKALMKDVYSFCVGPYPAKHDISHIEKVVENLYTLITSIA